MHHMKEELFGGKQAKQEIPYINMLQTLDIYSNPAGLPLNSQYHVI